jgi:ribosomal-protein-alanine N-acetyltransferase
MPPAEPRPLREADLARVVEIEVATFSDPWTRSSFRETLAREEVIGLALDDPQGRLIGYGIGVLAADEGEILNLAIDTTARRQGLGRRLVDALVERMRKGGAEQVFLEVRRSNLAAIGLYRSAGFSVLGERRGYYRQPREDALTMGLIVTRNTAKKG